MPTLTWVELRDRWLTPDGDRALRAALDALRAHRDDWETHLAGIAETAIIANGKDLRYAPLGECFLEGVKFVNTNLENANLWRAKLARIHVVRSCLRYATLQEADLSDSSFSGCDLQGAHMEHARLNRASLNRVEIMDRDASHALGTKGYNRLAGAFFDYADFTDVVMRGAYLERVQAPRAVFMGADLSGSNLSGANLTGAVLTGAVFDGVFLRNTVLDKVVFGPSHDQRNDGAEFVKLSRRDRWLNWIRLKLWVRPVLWVLSITVVLQIRDIVKWLRPDAPLVGLASLTALTAVLVLLSAAFYQFFSPAAIREFTETGWVDGHSLPRLLYLRESLRHHGQIATGVCIAAALLCACYVVVRWLLAWIANL